MDWVNIVGLAFGFLGTLALAYGLLVSDATAVNVGVSRWSGGTAEDKRQLPAVQDRLRQRRNTIVGLVLLAGGFVLQAVAAWPN